MNKEMYKYSLIEQAKVNAYIILFLLAERNKKIWNTLGCMYKKSAVFINSKHNMRVTFNRITDIKGSHKIELTFEYIENPKIKENSLNLPDLARYDCLGLPIYYEFVQFKHTEIYMCYAGYRLTKENDVYKINTFWSPVEMRYNFETNVITTTNNEICQNIWDKEYNDLAQEAIYTKMVFGQIHIGDINRNIRDYIMPTEDKDDLIRTCLEANQMKDRPTMSILADWLCLYQTKRNLKGS